MVVQAFGILEKKISHSAVHMSTRKGRTYVDDAGNVALDGSTAEKQINLVVVIPVPPKVLDDTEAALAVRNRCVHVMLLALLIDRKAL